MADIADDSDDEEYDVLSSDNFDTFRWKNKIKVNVCKCLKLITPIQLSRCKKTLVKVWFQYPSTFQNIRVILLNCPNILDMSFEDVLVDEYQPYDPNRDPGNNEEIFHDKLRIIEITTSSPGLSKNEYLILDFLTRGVTFKQLEALTFWRNMVRLTEVEDHHVYNPGGQSQWQGGAELNEVVERYSKINSAKNSTVGNFILKNRATLKTLWIGGTGFSLYDPQDFPAENVQILKEHQLDSFTFSFSGPTGNEVVFLENQNNLKKLVLFSRFFVEPQVEVSGVGVGVGVGVGGGGGDFKRCCKEEQKIDANKISSNEIKPLLYSGVSNIVKNLVNCISRNVEHLTEIIIYPKVTIDKSRHDLIAENLLDNFTINCDIFSNCKSLKHLTVGIICFQNLDENGYGQTTFLGAKLLNIHCIPESLAVLQMYAEDFILSEVDLLGEKLQNFQNLEKFTFSTSPLKRNNAYTVKTDWIKALGGLPKISEFSFFNNQYEDLHEVKRFLASVSNGRNNGNRGQQVQGQQPRRQRTSRIQTSNSVQNLENADGNVNVNSINNEMLVPNGVAKIRMGQVVQIHGNVHGDCFRVTRRQV